MPVPARLSGAAFAALLLTLLLYLSGGVLAAGHFHEHELEPADHSCALCQLATMAGATPVAVAFMLAIGALPLCPLRTGMVSPWRHLLPSARAPPTLLS